MGRWVLAIDFGTTTTSAATGLGDGTAQVVEVGGAPRMPSVVLATESGDLVVGAAAESQLALAPDRAERTPKRRLGDEVMLLGTRPVRPVEAVAAILRTIADEATRRQGGTEPGELRLTHPARWGSVRRAALAEAASLAGLPDPVFVAEPVAAAIHFADERIVPGAFVAVYDLGGGTFDTAVLRRSAEGFDVVGIPGGDENLGGELFDDRLFAHVGSRLAADAPEAWEALRFSTERTWRKAGHDLRMEVRRAKEALSANAEYTVYVGAPVDTAVVVTRDELETLIAADVTRTVDELEATITRAGLALDDLAAVNLVGGSSRIPLVTRMVAERMGQVPQTWGDPKAAVALGAVKATDLTTVSSGSNASGDGTDRRTAPVVKLPESVGGYDVVAELGRGGMGVVYLARQPSLGRSVAVKTLPMLDAGLTERLQREATVLGELQHPHIATVIDVGTDERGTHVVMPFFAGGTAAHVLGRDGRMEPGAAAGILAAVAEALAATHAKGFLHRDVKPSNILLSADGDAYLADFGLALPVFDSGRLTSSKSVLGTAPFIAPEILADESATPASDVYALGVTGYQLLTGQLPYSGSNVLAVVDAVRRGDAPSIGELAADVPAELTKLVESAFAADAADRPSDLRAWAAGVRAAAAPLPVRPAPPVGWTAAVAAADQPTAPSKKSPGTAKTERRDTDGIGSVAALAQWRQRLAANRRVLLPVAVLLVIALIGGGFALTGGSSGGKAEAAGAGAVGPEVEDNADQGGASTGAAATQEFAVEKTEWGADVKRLWKLDGGRLSAELAFTNPTGAAISGSYIEVIPKSAAASVDDIDFSPAPAKVINRDPIVQYDLTIAAGGTTELRYSTKVAETDKGESAVETLARLQTEWADALTEYQRAAGIKDTVPPGLTVLYPAPGAVVTSPDITLAGMAETGARVTVNGNPVAIDESGQWRFPAKLAKGTNSFALTATDAAGNATNATVGVTYKEPGSTEPGSGGTGPVAPTTTARPSSPDGPTATTSPPTTARPAPTTTAPKPNNPPPVANDDYWWVTTEYYDIPFVDNDSDPDDNVTYYDHFNDTPWLGEVIDVYFDGTRWQLTWAPHPDTVGDAKVRYRISDSAGQVSNYATIHICSGYQC